MKTTIQEVNGSIVATLEGRLDTSATLETEKALHPLYNAANQTIILDCKDLDYISSSGLRLFITLLKKAKHNNCRIKIHNMNDEVRQVFIMTGFINSFEME